MSERRLCDTDVAARTTPPGSLRAALREVVDAARPGTSIPPIDCTNHCGMGPCDCSGEWRVQSWSIDVPRLRELLEADRD